VPSAPAGRLTAHEAAVSALDMGDRAAPVQSLPAVSQVPGVALPA
jgi:hypothetical protein